LSWRLWMSGRWPEYEPTRADVLFFEQYILEQE